MSYVRKILVLLLLLLFLLSGCIENNNQIKYIDWRIMEKEKPGQVSNLKILRVAVASMTSPKETYESYQQMIKLIGNKLGYHVELVQRNSYTEINDLLKNREVDIAFICSYAYVMGKKEFGLELLAVPQIKGKTTYRGYLIVNSASNIFTFNDLQGRDFAFTDPLSFTGYFYPQLLLKASNSDYRKYFRKTYFTKSHDNSIKAVMQGLVDGAAVDSLIFDYMAHKDNNINQKIRVIAVSEEAGMPPLVARPGLPNDLKQKIRTTILGLHETEEGQKVLKNLQIERFVQGNDHDYDGIRQAAKQVVGSEY